MVLKPPPCTLTSWVKVVTTCSRITVGFFSGDNPERKLPIYPSAASPGFEPSSGINILSAIRSSLVKNTEKREAFQ
jgi:hypothetical protein